MMVYLANALSAKGIQVHLYLVNQTGPFQSEIDDSVEMIDLDAKRGVKSIFFALRKILKHGGLDVMIATQPHVNATISLAGIGLKQKPVLILREANTPSKKYSEYGVISRIFYKIGHPFADHYVAVSNGVRKDMIRYYSLKETEVTTIYNPIVDETIHQNKLESVGHPWILQNDFPVLVTMSRVVEQKDHKTLFKAFAILKKEVEAKLLVLGDDTQNPKYTFELKKLITQLNLRDSVEFIGFQENPYAFLSRASLFVLSSRFEGLPGSLIQALACGCPVVSTDCPSGPNEILEGGKYGKLVPVGNEEKLAQAMIESLTEEHDSDRLKKRADDFSVNCSAQLYLQLIEKLIPKTVSSE